MFKKFLFVSIFVSMVGCEINTSTVSATKSLKKANNLFETCGDLDSAKLYAFTGFNIIESKEKASFVITEEEAYYKAKVERYIISRRYEDNCLKGTKDNPIEYTKGMQTEQGKWYKVGDTILQSNIKER